MMFGFDPNVLLVITLAAIAAGALCYALLFPRIETEKKTDARLSRVKSAETDMGKVKAARDRVQEMSKRRKSVQDSLKELEKKQEEKSRKIGNSTIKSRLVQTGLPLRMSQFYIMSAVLGIVVLLVGMARPEAEIDLPRREGTVVLAFDVSASMKASPWLLPMVRPNCSRSVAYRAATSSADCARPVAAAAMPRRPASRPDSAIPAPRPCSPTSRSPVTGTSS